MNINLKVLLVVPVLAIGFSGKASADVVTCSSDGGAHHYCSANTGGGVTLVHQLSKAGCWQNDTWGYDRRGIWVANGCRAEFRTGYSGSERRGSYYHNEDRWDDRDDDDDDKDAAKVVGAALAVGLIAAAAVHHNKDDDNDDRGRGYRSVYTCESQGDRHHYCSLGGGRGNYHVELKRQLSNARCQYNRSWGYDRGGIWVSDGCRGEFWVD